MQVQSSSWRAIGGLSAHHLRKAGTILLLIAAGWYPARAEAPTAFPREIDFGLEKHMGQFISGRELEIWASQRGLEIAPDCPLRDLADSEAEVISSRGSSFELFAPGQGRVYLYLDFVSFRKQGTRNRPLEPHCYPSSNEIRLPESTELPVQFLEIFVNGQRISTQVFGAGAQPASPLVLPITRELMPDRRLEIELRPGPGNQLLAVWDAFLSEVPPETD
ncbi:MAG TPA: hypothetical protein DEA96_14945 [Leptospiraceae bacterium]|nr:hypothetical protein [Spirochaetaceae bacterium]HBS06263.1 hypothetical protein [Leptospiraceae bacterium]|tara:strand:- start:89122 stop:89781 length:660 start_codon:yes stop_codon:yes gene_type:complete